VPRSFHRIALLAAVFALAACGGQPQDQQVQQEQQVQGMRVVLQTTAAFSRAPDFDSRVQSTVDAALRYWGGSWSDVNGRTITLVDDPSVECNRAASLGCFDGNIRMTTRDPSIGTFSCIEETVLVHEIGHAVIGDFDHTDPRWMEMDSLAAELSGRVGYSDAGEVPCATYVSVWRHPLGSP
jgi:hypothetical protein